MTTVPSKHTKFPERLSKLYDVLRNSSKLQSCGAVCILVGGEDAESYARSISMQTWLFDQAFRDSLLVFTKDTFAILSNAKKLDHIKQMINDKENHSNEPLSDLKFQYISRTKQDGDKEAFDQILGIIKSTDKSKSIGMFGKDKSLGAFADHWRSVLKQEGFTKVDITQEIALLLASKDDEEISRVEKAAEISSKLFSKFLKRKLVDIVDAEKKVKHSKLSDMLNSAIADPKYVSTDDATYSEFCYPPIFQSGHGRYSLRYSVTSDDNNIDFGAIVCMFGVRYKSYCSNIGRTFLIFPSAEMRKTYEFLLDVQEKIFESLKEGLKMCDIHKAVKTFSEDKDMTLASLLTPTFGFMSGIEFKDMCVVISSKCEAVCKKGMVFQVSVGLADVPTGDEKKKDKKYSLLLADTVVVEDSVAAKVLTTGSKKVNTISVLLRDDEETSQPPDGDSSQSSKPKKRPDGLDDEVADAMNMTRASRRPTALLKNKTRQELTSESKRMEHQKELGKHLNESAKQRLMIQSGKQAPEKIKKSNVSYKHSSLFPHDASIADSKMFVDKKYETVILPIYGSSVPFHISTIKNVSLTVEGDYAYLRINFFHPGAAIVKPNVQQFSNPSAIYVKEVTFRASNQKGYGDTAAPANNLFTSFRLIKDVQKLFKEQEAEKRELEGVVKQDALVVSSSKANPKLKDLCVRPNITQKRMTGVLEAHTNGVRYTTARGDNIDILYSNVKHAFYQSCDSEMIILLHFHLKHPIIFGKKKQADIQFFTEVGELTTDLNKNRNRMDKDDIASEQAEKDYRQKLKSIFRGFVDKLELVSSNTIRFETPFRELGFHGTPSRSMVHLIPTSSCLVNLSEWPPFVVTLDEVELVNFERVQFHLKNFDIVFIFKEYSKKVVMINSIAVGHLDNIKDWLNSCDIKYMEGSKSLNWPNVMKTILDDVEGFFANGGWEFLEPESDPDESNQSDNAEEVEDATYQPSEDSESAEESESEFEEDDKVSSSSEHPSADEESGMSWSDLSEEARQDDMEKNFSDDEKRHSKKPEGRKDLTPKPSTGKKNRR